MSKPQNHKHCKYLYTKALYHWSQTDSAFPILLLLLVLRQPPFSVPIESPISDGFDTTFFGSFPHTGGDTTFPSVTATPLYSFELDTVGGHASSATVGGGSNDTLTKEGFYHEKTE